MFLTEVLTTSAALLRGVLPGPLRDLVPCPRRLETCPGGLRIDLHRIGAPGTEEAAVQLEECLSEVPGVERAEVNGRLGFVFVACDPRSMDQDELLSIAAKFDELQEREHEWPIRLAEVHLRATVRLAASVTGVGLTLAGNVVRLPRLPSIVPAVLHLANATPVFREQLDRRIGRAPANALFTTANLVTTTLTLRPMALVVQSAISLGRYVEAKAGRYAWERLEERLADRPGTYRHIRARSLPRPTHLPHGPVESYADVISPVAVGAYGVTRVMSRGRRALPVLVAATPKIAYVGRDAFAGAINRALGRHDTVVFDPDTLRRMDRIDLVILDTDALTTGSWTIDRVKPLVEGVDTDQLYSQLHTFIDFSDPGGIRTSEGWSVRPIADAEHHLPEVAGGRRERGLRAIEVSRDGTPVAIAGLAPEIDPLAVPIVVAAKAAGTVILAGDDGGLARRLAVSRTLAGGEEFGRQVYDLQSQGHGVVMVSRGRRHGLAQADIGVGVMDAEGLVPWDADVAGPLQGVHLFLTSLPWAVNTSRNAVRLGAIGAVVGCLLAFAGPERTALRRAYYVNAGVSIAAIALGEWAGRTAGRTPVPLHADTNPSARHLRQGGAVPARLVAGRDRRGRGREAAQPDGRGRGTAFLGPHHDGGTG